jgi:ubiquinone/menaquinone biosynthesis C-methylase UbiE
MDLEKSIFVTPDTHEKLYYLRENGNYLVTEKGERYEFIDGFPNLTFPRVVEQRRPVSYYDDFAKTYDIVYYQTFMTFREDEVATRNKMIDRLNLRPDARILEIACGTGRDSELIAARLGKGSEYVIADFSSGMLTVCKKKLDGFGLDIKYCMANAVYLPFEDNYFDAVFSFDALGEFPDIKKSLAEMVRVAKTGSKVVVGSISMPPWLKDTYFYKVFSMNQNALTEMPITDIPVEARNVNIQWVIGGIYYLIDFEVGEGEPYADFDFEIQGGVRGGTLRTRYEGKLEGVTKEGKELAVKAAAAKGLPMAKWLDEHVKKAAKKDLNL